MKKKKLQVVFIHGGDMFDDYEEYLGCLNNMEFNPNKDIERSKRWFRQLDNKLGDNFKYILPTMPNKNNAKYVEWKIWFEKVLEYVDDNFILLGHSLGGTFLIKYLSENKISKNIKKLFLISSVINGPERKKYQLDTFFINKSLIKNISKLENIILIHSKDDNEVSFDNFEELAKFLPEAEQMIFADRGHFMGEEFSELVEKIKETT